VTRFDGRRRVGAIVALAALLVPVALSAPASAHHVAARPTLGACPLGQVSPTSVTGFRDIAGYVFAREINCLTDHGIARGREPGSYAPGAPVLRRQMALFLTRIVTRAGIPLPTGDAGFADVAGLDQTTREAVNAVAGLGIARGTAPGRYAPDAVVTRAQMASFLNNVHAVLAGAPFPSTGDHFDGDQGVHEANVNAIAGAGIGVGVGGAGGDRDFGPARAVTRGQMAGFLGRLLDIEVANSRIPPHYAATAVYDPAAPLGLSAAGVPCTLRGTEGDDVLTGTSGADVVCGLGGDDTLEGAAGQDVLDGGPGSDRLLGGDGDDDLDGGPGRDLLDGGVGTNWCVPVLDDVLEQCRYDLEQPTVEYLAVTPDTVRVDDADVPVTVLARVLDDTGVVSAQAQSHASTSWQNGPGFDWGRLVAGTVRDGVWEIPGRARRYSAGGTFTVSVFVQDRLGRSSSAYFENQLRVVSSTVDQQPPVVQSVALTSSTGSFPLDVREQPAEVTIDARITDELSGISAPPRVCAQVSEDGGRFHGTGDCTTLQRTTGTAHDGHYRGVLQIPQRSVSGEYGIELTAPDHANPTPSVTWVGEKAYQQQLEIYNGSPGDLRLLPAGAGHFGVIGVQSDDTAPSVTEVRLSPTEVDTLTTSQTVEVLVHAVDPGPDGVWRVGASLASSGTDGSSPTLEGVQTVERLSGTALDGWWRLELTMPQGTPPGTYYLHTFVEDTRQRSLYLSPGSPYEGSLGHQTLSEPATVTVVDSRS
jgi:hypothetical protein